MYQPKRTSRSEMRELRGLKIHFRHWGPDDAPTLLYLHGWMDVGGSFQFVVDALARERHVIAPDWRGFGLSEWQPQPPYWFPNLVGDLEAVLDSLDPEGTVDVVGHSMGGNVLGLYAGIRPERFRRVALLEGFGLSDTHADMAPGRYAQWLAQLKSPPRLRPYRDMQEFAERVRADNPRLTAERALFVARELGAVRADGTIDYAADPWHRATSPVLYRAHEARACWQRIEAPTLWVEGAESHVLKRLLNDPEDYCARKACFRHLSEVRIEGSGHNLHYEQPEQLAMALDEFFAC
ncbi:MAG: Tropinesterase [Rhodocyclaceae bacterium]|nr:Tropinesterase [Rhodocyclaceae bacterium]